MAKDQPGVVGVVVAFVARPLPAVYLTPLDRMAVCEWQESVRAAGYDRMIIHEHEAGESGEFGDFLCLHRRGEAWSRWGFARKGKVVSVWCCLTGADAGDYASMADAFASVMPDGALAAKGTRPSLGKVTELTPFIRPAVSRLGSAA